MSRPIIALTTDFGQADGYVGIMKVVILGICPEAALIDITHDIRPHAVRQAAYILSTVAPYFPPGTVHLVVVDPGVGSERRPIVIQTDRATYVAPDNGVLSLVLQQEPIRLAISLHPMDPWFYPPHISATFHGRDIFAPAAAHLACGVDPYTLGLPLTPADLVTLPSIQPQLSTEGVWQGEILHVDRFGNLITNFRLVSSDFQSPVSIRVGKEQIERISRTYADVEPGELLAYLGSSGYLEIAVREGNAAVRLGVTVGDPVCIEGLP
ncbi:MAG: SAM hydrolase/SAM-dependent halogenase family protein [Anaerolineae bacterium]